MARVTFLHRTRQEGTAAPADNFARGGLSPALAVACARTPDADRAVLWAVPCDADCGAGSVPRGARATAGGGPGGVGLADGVCPAWGGPSERCPTCGQRLVCTGVIPREEHLPAWHQRSAPHEIRITGEPCQGRGVPGGSQGTRTTACEHCSGAAKAPRTAIAPSSVGPAEPVTGRITRRPQWKLHSVRLPKPGQAASVRGPSNPVLSEVLRAGRVSTAVRSPLSTPDSILMCL